MADFNVDDFVDSVKSGASKAKTEAEKIAKNVTEKTESIVSQIKLQYTAKGVKNKIDEALLDLGRFIYDEFSNEEIDGPIKEKCDHIKELFAELEDLNDEITNIKNTVMCNSCGSYNAKGSKFCNVCGSQIYGGADDEQE